jgi:hypothetical protein
MSRRRVAVAALAAVWAVTADAGIIPVLTGGAPTAEGSSFRYTYDVDLQGDQRIDPANLTRFTIFYFAGFVPGSNVQPTGWAFQAVASGLDPDFFGTDNPGVLNLVWTYVGGGTIGAGPDNQVDLGAFSALSSFNATTTETFAARATKDSPLAASDGTPTANFGFVEVASSLAPQEPVAPEPGTLGLLALGGLGLVGGAAVRRRRAAKAQAA